MFPSRALALLCALPLAACSREVETRPFQMRATDELGQSIVSEFPDPGILTVVGNATLPSPTALRLDTVNPKMGIVTFQFDGSIASGVQFPPDADGKAVKVQVNLNGAGRGPKGPLTIAALRVDIAGRSRFLMGEDALQQQNGLPALEQPLAATTAAEIGDLPTFSFVTDGLAFEPNRCGDIYYDKLQAGGSGAAPVLGWTDRATIEVSQGADLKPWTVVLVSAWHRLGKGGSGCDPDARAWGQMAAWR